MQTDLLSAASREILVHALYEAAELEHNLMCTYLYAAFSLKSGVDEGLQPSEAAAVGRWRRVIQEVAIDEMSHLTAVWNITAALGAAPRFGRTNFPLDPGYLPASVVVKLAPFNAAVLQHFVHLERPAQSAEPDGDGFALAHPYARGTTARRLTPMGINYATVGEFYQAIGAGLRSLVARVGEAAAFCGDPALQLSPSEIDLPGARRVVCIKTALAAFDQIVTQGEGAPQGTSDSHFEKFCAIRAEYLALRQLNPDFIPAHPAATNPVLRRPPQPEGHVWIEAEDAAQTVDVANSAYGLMLRLLAYSYAIPAPHPDKALVLDLAIALMRAVTPLGERAARLAAGASNADCNAGMSFTTLRDSAALPSGPAARRFFTERLAELAAAAANLPGQDDARVNRAARALASLAQRAAQRFDLNATAAATAPVVPAAAANSATAVAPASGKAANADAPPSTDGVEVAEARDLTLLFEGRKCIHSRFCVTGAPTVFLANVVGPWLHPETLDVERLVAVAQECPSGAIRYRRKDGRPDEQPPPVNLVAIREAGPYAVRGTLRLEGRDIGYRATLCRCGASKNKPFCDGSHHAIHFDATGEPPSAHTDMLPVRDGVLAVEPQTDGPLLVRGNVEITSGTGRVVERTAITRLCRCGGSGNKPFCDGTHAKIGFKS
ncbi:MAG TPA: ferritin-like domain-containing protein [Steroidobacteraceae bacterium]|nr:ferritin-like domain-containing protein [Steroidobacteraceae bacterium]